MIGVRTTIGLHEQAAFMKVYWPAFRTKVSGPILRCTGNLCPSELSETYKVEIQLKGGGFPTVRVHSPTLVTRAGAASIPHMYEQETLCLYRPGWNEWTPAKAIATTIVPWTALWLYFYEAWHATGEWLGGGHAPDPQFDFKKRSNDDQFPVNGRYRPRSPR